LKSNTQQPQQSREFKAKTGPAMFDIIRNQLYSRKVESPIREYLTNAADIHTRLGKSIKDILITLPTTFFPCLTIRDQGSGMSPEEIPLRYIRYFSSDKANRDTETGSLGLGCKSGFAYTTEFTVTSYHLGIRYIYKGYLDRSLMGKMDLLLATPTDEPDGMKISIPVPEADFTKFRKATWEVLKAFEIQPTIVNPPTGIDLPTPYDFQERNYTVRDCTSKTFAVVMGNVAYAFKPNQIRWRYAKGANASTLRKLECFMDNLNHPLVLKAPLNSVDYLPSREQLEFSDKTQRFITSAICDVYKELRDTYQLLLDNCGTIQDLFELHGHPEMALIAAAKSTGSWRGNTITPCKLTNFYNHTRLLLAAYSDILHPCTLTSGCKLQTSAHSVKDITAIDWFIAPYPIQPLENEIINLKSTDAYKGDNKIIAVLAIRGNKKYQALAADPAFNLKLWDTSSRVTTARTKATPKKKAKAYICTRTEIEAIQPEDLDLNQPIVRATSRQLVFPGGGTLALNNFRSQLPAVQKLFAWALNRDEGDIVIQGVPRATYSSLDTPYNWEWLLDQIKQRAPHLSYNHIAQARDVGQNLRHLIECLTPEDIAALPDNPLRKGLQAWYAVQEIFPSSSFTLGHGIYCMQLIFPVTDEYKASYRGNFSVTDTFPHYPTYSSNKLDPGILSKYIRAEMDYIIASQSSKAAS
jgi:hypothetical protein